MKTFVSLLGSVRESMRIYDFTAGIALSGKRCIFVPVVALAVMSIKVPPTSSARVSLVEEGTETTT